MISIIEDHDEAFHIWKANCERNRTVIHVDAHSDIQNDEELHIGSYIHHAIKQKIIKEYYWIVPKPMTLDRISLKKIIKHLRKQDIQIMKKCYKNGVIEGKLKDCYIWVGSFDFLPLIKEKVLLDIDIDYFVTRYTFSSYKEPIDIWQKPVELLNCLKELGITYNDAIICKSVSGGYTPIQWSCLAPYIYYYLKHSVELFPLELLNKGSLIYWENSKEVAKQYFEGLINEIQEPQFQGCVYYWLVRINLELGDYSTVKDNLFSLYECDKKYNTYWLCPGIPYYHRDKYEKGMDHFELWESVLSSSSHFYSAWAETMYSKDIKLSMRLCKKAIKLDDKFIDAHILLGDCNKKIGNLPDAIKNYEKSLKMVLSQNYNSFYLIEQCRESNVRGVYAPLIKQILTKCILCYAKNNSTEKVIQWYKFYTKTFTSFSPYNELRLCYYAPYLYKSNINLIINIFKSINLIVINKIKRSIRVMKKFEV
ncbi:tetratricopeptide repeat protein [Lederbergia ruris]|uniref:tetratricopeptide repeat protein n=1 Tax=Lederbergia ruris TaxID=217495 RepID=UPI0039A3BAB0